MGERIRQLTQELDEFDFRMGRCSFTSFTKSKLNADTRTKKMNQSVCPNAGAQEPPRPRTTTGSSYTRHTAVRLKFGKSTIAPNVKAWTQQTSSFYCPTTNRSHLYNPDAVARAPRQLSQSFTDYPTPVHEEHERQEIQKLMLEMDAVEKKIHSLKASSKSPKNSCTTTPPVVQT